MMRPQRLYNNVRLLDGAGPCLENVRRLDQGAMPMIQSMARTGLQIDLSHFKEMEGTLERDMDKITEEVRELTGYYINVDSGDQVSDLLFKKMGLKQARLKMTKSGDRESVEDEVLTAIQHDHPVVPKILEYKEFSKLLGTYVRPMPKLARKVGPNEWRMFPNFNTTRVPSGRLSCKEPNLLAMPTRTDRGREIRNGFITRPGWCYLSVDESQIEPRIAAHRSKDEALINVYLNEEDIYSDFATAAFKLKDERYFAKEALKWKYPTLNKVDHRRPAKTCVLASIYDVTGLGLSDQMPVVCKNCNWLSLPTSDKNYTRHPCHKFESLWGENKCTDLINSFYLKYRGLMLMRKADHRYMMQHALMVDMWGRILHVQAVRSILEWVVATALREGSNFPIQSSAQGTVKLAMAAIYDDMEDAGMFEVANVLLQVHDELLFEVRNDYAQDLMELVKYRFETCVQLDVPIKAGGVMAENWGALPK